MKEQAAAAANVPIVQLFAAIAVAVVIYQVTLDVQADQTTVGGFVSFIAAMLLVTAPLKRLTGVDRAPPARIVGGRERVRAGGREARRTIAARSSSGARVARSASSNVTFSYPGAERPALRDMSLQIRSGETVALVGQSGSGKTTLANLVPRFYHPAPGRILIDGHDIEAIRLASLRANIGLVSQDVTLVQRHHRGQHRLRRQSRRQSRPRSSQRPRPRMPGSSSRRCRRD